VAGVPTSGGGWTRCTATSAGAVTKAPFVSCPVTPPGAGTFGQPANKQLRLLCEVAPPARVTRPWDPVIAHMSTRSGVHPRKKRATRTKYVLSCRSI
jgi:hypothetical protein